MDEKICLFFVAMLAPGWIGRTLSTLGLTESRVQMIETPSIDTKYGEVEASPDARDNFTCQECGARRRLTIDHITAEVNGGTLELSNLQTLCGPCNSRKGDR